MRALILSLAALAFGAGFADTFAGDQQTNPVAPAAATAPSNDENKLICRYMYHNGTLVRTQTCHTQREWDSIRTYNQHQVSEAQQRGMTSTPH